MKKKLIELGKWIGAIGVACLASVVVLGTLTGIALAIMWMAKFITIRIAMLFIFGSGPVIAMGYLCREIKREMFP